MELAGDLPQRSRSGTGRVLHRVLGVPPGAGILFSRSTRRRLVAAVLGSFLTALLDTLGVAALVPLMQLLTTEDRDTGALGVITRVLGRDVGDTRLAAVIAGGVVTAFVLKGVLSVAFRWWQLGFLARQAVATDVRLLRGFLRAPYRMHQEREIADLMRVLGDAVSQTYGQVVAGTMQILAEVLTLVLLGVLLLVADPVPALAAALYFGIVSWVLVWQLRPRVETAGEEMLEHNVEAFNAVLFSLGGIKEIKVRHNSEHFVGHFAAAQGRLVGVQRRFAFLSELPKYVLEILFITGVALLTVLAFGTTDSASALATLALFVAAGSRVMPSLVRLIGALASVRYGLSGVGLVVEDLHRYGQVEPESRPGPDARRVSGDIELSEVTFRYPDADEPVLEGVGLRVPRGSSLALVGPSGAGKSTLVDLLLGLQSPTSGSIRVGGLDISEDLRSWQAGIGLVPQVVYLYAESLLDNITFGDEQPVDRERLADAVHRAQLDDVVAGMPRGLDTNLGERGGRLSGGQQQRVGIARALYHRPEVMVLDEATSALDNLTERKIADTIAELHGETTLVVVAHRLSTVRHCDQVAYLSGGRLAAVGTFEEVRAANAEFAELVRLGSLEPLQDQR